MFISYGITIKSGIAMTNDKKDKDLTMLERMHKYPYAHIEGWFVHIISRAKLYRSYFSYGKIENEDVINDAKKVMEEMISKSLMALYLLSKHGFADKDKNLGQTINDFNYYRSFVRETDFDPNVFLNKYFGGSPHVWEKFIPDKLDSNGNPVELSTFFEEYKTQKIIERINEDLKKELDRPYKSPYVIGQLIQHGVIQYVIAGIGSGTLELRIVGVEGFPKDSKRMVINEYTTIIRTKEGYVIEEQQPITKITFDVIIGDPDET